MASCDKAENPSPCARGCGIYGAPRNHNLCSQCYKAFLKEKAPKDALTLSEKISSLTIKTEKDDSTIKTKTQRCMVCRKRVGLIGFSCKCGEIFCRNHRYPEEHACTFNFKSIGRVILAKENPLCKADKLENRI
ncbi:putative zinc finger A20 and AN1 domain-containing stress-associated protein 8 [Lycium barbarum]|uniref:putative zinc finger A20 and AN1 domain-containing stress-associated protein 8 n=1 Tax=Lycium barbarum TaxID=112863 RepID=UPI00293F2C08|nr:putative zinc finger A20 and AN1 domain-containing stress-associated protein 8 [Lycium barbarum]